MPRLVYVSSTHAVFDGRTRIVAGDEATTRYVTPATCSDPYSVRPALCCSSRAFRYSRLFGVGQASPTRTHAIRDEALPPPLACTLPTTRARSRWPTPAQSLNPLPPVCALLFGCNGGSSPRRRRSSWCWPPTACRSSRRSSSSTTAPLPHTPCTTTCATAWSSSSSSSASKEAPRPRAAAGCASAATPPARSPPSPRQRVATAAAHALRQTLPRPTLPRLALAASPAAAARPPRPPAAASAAPAPARRCRPAPRWPCRQGRAAAGCCGRARCAPAASGARGRCATCRALWTPPGAGLRGWWWAEGCAGPAGGGGRTNSCWCAAVDCRRGRLVCTFGDRRSLVDFAHVDNLVAALVLAARALGADECRAGGKVRREGVVALWFCLCVVRVTSSSTMTCASPCPLCAGLLHQRRPPSGHVRAVPGHRPGARVQVRRPAFLATQLTTSQQHSLAGPLQRAPRLHGGVSVPTRA